MASYEDQDAEPLLPGLVDLIERKDEARLKDLAAQARKPSASMGISLDGK